MSFDEKRQLDNDEIGLAHLLRIFWSYKHILLLFIILSVPISLWWTTTLTPTYKAETVFEKPSQKNTKRNENPFVSSSTVLSSILTGSTVKNDSFFSEIRSDSFLKTVILNNPKLDSQTIRQFCPLPSKETARFSLRSFLILLGISENKSPSESQKISLLLRCVNNMLGVDLDDYGPKKKSSAYRLSIESGDPDFSANLVNQIVEKYFIRLEKKRDQDFQNVKKYLSKVITEAQLEYAEANKLLQSFKIKHTLLMNKNLLSGETRNINRSTSSAEMVLPPSPFVGELNREMANLSQLEKSLSELNQARVLLSTITQRNREKIKAFISSTNVQGVFSRTFITAIAKINDLSAGTGIIEQKISKIMSRELESLIQQIQVLEEKIDKQEEQTMQLMGIENRFQELALDYSKKLLIFEELKNQLKERILTAGLDNVQQPVLLTKAVPPFNKHSPNKKSIVIIGVVLSIFFGIALVLIRQSNVRTVFSLSQLRILTKFLSCYKIKYKQLKQMGETSDKTAISQSFFSRAMEMGKLGCIVDISQKGKSSSLASEFSKAVARLIATDNSKLVCLDPLPSTKPFSAGTQKNLMSNHSNLNVQEISSENILSFNDEDGFLGAGEIEKIKNKYSEYEKIVCSLGSGIADLTKFKFIEQCDFYILIGRSCQFDESTYEKFSNTVWEKEKCLGFFLID